LQENFGLAIADASECLKLDPKFVKGYYRRASANLALSKFAEALRDFAEVRQTFFFFFFFLHFESQLFVGARFDVALITIHLRL
jgi:hypothetical protein